MLKVELIEFNFGIWAKLMQLTQWLIIVWLIKWVPYKFSLYVKMSESTDLTYYQKSRDMILNQAKYYYKNNKERLRKQARDKYINLFEEEKK